MVPPPIGRKNSGYPIGHPRRVTCRFNGAAPNRAEEQIDSSDDETTIDGFNGAAPNRAEEREQTSTARGGVVPRFNGAAPNRAEEPSYYRSRKFLANTLQWCRPQ